jgi:TPR repeat protein
MINVTTVGYEVWIENQRLYVFLHRIPWNSFSYVEIGNQKDAKIQYNLGLCYLNGKGLPQDESEARRLFHLSADQGYAIAQSKLGWCYENGIGVILKKDLSEAAKYYRLAAHQGHAASQCNLWKPSGEECHQTAERK